jgi:hypothetical protein
VQRGKIIRGEQAMYTVIIIILGLIGAWFVAALLTALLKLVIILLVPASIIFIAYIVWKKA